MKGHNDILYELKSDPRFMSLVNDILQHRPTIPSHDPRNENTEVWKHESAKRMGFDIWITFLKLEDRNV